MNKEEIEEIKNTLKISKPYNELGTYNYFNCESIEKLLNEYQELKEIEKEHQRINGELRVENQKLKKQYCERTDCIGRLGNSKKVEQLIKENQELKDRIDKANWWLEEMLKQVKNDETKAIIYGTLDLLLKEIKNE